MVQNIIDCLIHKTLLIASFTQILCIFLTVTIPRIYISFICSSEKKKQTNNRTKNKTKQNKTKQKAAATTTKQNKINLVATLCKKENMICEVNVILYKHAV